MYVVVINNHCIYVKWEIIVHWGKGAWRKWYYYSLWDINYHQNWPNLISMITLTWYRKLPKNMILAGLWYSTEKPRMQLLLQPVIEMLRDLESTGMNMHGWEIFHYTYTIVHVKMQVLRFILQMLNRLLWEYVSYAAHVISLLEQVFRILSSSMGYMDAVIVSSLERKWLLKMVVLVHTFPYILESPKGPPRSQEACIQYARKAIATHSVVSILMLGIVPSHPLSLGYELNYFM